MDLEGLDASFWELSDNEMAEIANTPSKRKPIFIIIVSLYLLKLRNLVAGNKLPSSNNSPKTSKISKKPTKNAVNPKSPAVAVTLPNGKYRYKRFGVAFSAHLILVPSAAAITRARTNKNAVIYGKTLSSRQARFN